MTVSTGATGPVNLTQSTGSSTTAVMSQKAVTDMISNMATQQFQTSFIIRNKASLNDYTSPGLVGAAEPTALNLPVSGTFYIFNLCWISGSVTQLAIGYTNLSMYMRYRYNNVWSAWGKVGS